VGATSELVEVGDLSSREIEPDRAIADLFSHRGGRKQSRKGGTQAAISQAQRLAGAFFSKSALNL